MFAALLLGLVSASLWFEPAEFELRTLLRTLLPTVLQSTACPYMHRDLPVPVVRHMRHPGRRQRVEPVLALGRFGEPPSTSTGTPFEFSPACRSIVDWQGFSDRVGCGSLPPEPLADFQSHILQVYDIPAAVWVGLFHSKLNKSLLSHHVERTKAPLSF
ncbi:hypothetical protein B0H11DRAFT_1977194 [Mycena galericulata]|nr:hypothetical protein B0H11DRAFT_1977194 [Mycena galericulata]